MDENLLHRLMFNCLATIGWIVCTASYVGRPLEVKILVLMVGSAIGLYHFWWVAIDRLRALRKEPVKQPAPIPDRPSESS